MKKLAGVPFSHKGAIARPSHSAPQRTRDLIPPDLVVKKRCGKVALSKHAVVRAFERSGTTGLREVVDLARQSGACEPEIAEQIAFKNPEFISGIASELEAKRSWLRSRPGGMQLLGDRPVPIRVTVAGMRAVLCGEAVITLLPPRSPKHRRFGGTKNAV